MTSDYVEALEELLEDAKNIATLKITDDFNKDAINYKHLDQYITELNTYYYKSFHKHFFPQYKTSLITEIEELLQIKSNQDMISQDLQANIKRYAKLYNQVKIVNRLLKNTREDINNLLYTVYREKEQENLELMYALKRISNAFNKLENMADILTLLREDKVWLDAVSLYPHMPKILVNIFENSPPKLDTIRRLIIRLKAVAKLIKQLQNQDISKKIVQNIIGALNNQINLIYKDKQWSNLPSAFVKDFNFRVETFTELISLYNELNKLDKIRNTAQAYEGLVLNFIRVLEKTLDFLENNFSLHSKDLLKNSLAIIDLKPNSLVSLTQAVNKTQASLDKFQNDVLETGEPDFAYLAKTVASFLEEYQALFARLQEEESLMQIIPIAKQLNLINLEFIDLGRYLQALTEKRIFAELMEDRYLDLMNILDSYISYTNNTRGDLERIMAPRNLSRVWKGFNVRTERIPLEVGKKIPPTYVDILAQADIVRKISHLETDTILHEEGDIFVITVDGMTTYEIPPLTLAQKG